jgi:hypothetical protein
VGRRGGLDFSEKGFLDGKVCRIMQTKVCLTHSGKRADTMRPYNQSVGLEISLFQWPTLPNHVIYSEINDVGPMHSIS